MGRGTTQLDDVFLALGDGTRRAILQRLGMGEAPVTALARPFTLSLNAVSKHIRILERAGLVRRRIQGREHLLALETKALDGVAEWIAAQAAQWSTQLDMLDALLKAQDAIEAARDPGNKEGRQP